MALELRYEVCIFCRRRWNVSLLAEVPESGYVCPHCRGKLWRGEIRLPQSACG